MDQKIEPLTSDDIDHIEAKRSWVRNHFDESARHQYETVEGKLRLLDTIIAARWIAPHETVKLQCLGITFGDALAQEMGLTWVAVEDEYGRDPALQLRGTTMIVFPMTMISKRVGRSESVDVRSLFAEACDKIVELRPRYEL